MTTTLLTPPVIDSATRHEFIALLSTAGLLAACSNDKSPARSSHRHLMTMMLDRPLVPLPVTDVATRREFIVGGLASALLLAACGDDGQEGEGAATDPQTWTVTDAFGEVEVPLAPRRIADLFPNAYGDDVLEIGGPLVALAGFVRPGDVRPSIDPGELKGVELLGSGPDLNLEALAATEPDLIISMAFNTEEILGELAAIARTYTFPEEHLDERSVTEQVNAVADLLGAGYQARAQVVSDYEDRIEQLRERRAPVVEDKTVGVVALYLDEGVAFVMGEETYCGQILADLSLTRPPRAAGVLRRAQPGGDRAGRRRHSLLPHGSGEDAAEFVGSGPMSTLGAVQAGTALDIVTGNVIMLRTLGPRAVSPTLEHHGHLVGST